MMNLNDMVDLYESCLQIRNNTKKVKLVGGKAIKGTYIPDIDRIILYTKNIEDSDDYDITLMHEIHHACDYSLSESTVEQLAKDTKKNDQEMIDFVKDLWNVKYEDTKRRNIDLWWLSPDKYGIADLKKVEK